MPDPIRILLVGGFLGAGKTTLIARAAEILAGRGQRVGLVTNDQAAGLVDTGLLRHQGCDVEEVAGGCFCCRFDDLMAALGRLEFGAVDKDSCSLDVLIGEPVGSCTDLAATVVRPLQLYHASHYVVSPFTVVIDPHRAVEVLGMLGAVSSFPAHVNYIYLKQLEEADLIAVNKADQLSPAERQALVDRLQGDYPAAQVVVLSAREGQGVTEWLDLVLQAGSTSGQRSMDVDYDTYADGEAALGWLNAVFRLEGLVDGEAPDWATVAAVALDGIRRSLIAHRAEVAHLKLRLVDPADTLALVGNLTRNAEDPSVRIESGSSRPASRQAELTVNARVRIEPETLETIVTKALESVCSALSLRLDREQLASFAPGRPVPTHRLSMSID